MQRSRRRGAQVPVLGLGGWPARALVSAALAATLHAGKAHASDAGVVGAPAAAVSPWLLLGAKIFFDGGLSANGDKSCASCHIPERAFSDGLPRAVGTGDRVGMRNTPSLVDLQRTHGLFGWDGRHEDLPSQLTSPFFAPAEHGLRTEAELLERLRRRPGYAEAIELAFAGREPELGDVARALHSFVGSLAASGSAFDRWRAGGSSQAVSTSAGRGFDLFIGRAQCARCHRVEGRWPTFTDDRFHAGAPLTPDRLRRLPEALTRRQGHRLALDEPDGAALGRMAVTGRIEDVGAFRTPSLRNVSVTGPYFHDGRFSTLAQAVEWELLYRGDRQGRPLLLTPDERDDLQAFLHTLVADDLAGIAARARALAPAPRSDEAAARR